MQLVIINSKIHQKKTYLQMKEQNRQDHFLPSPKKYFHKTLATQNYT